MTGEATPHTRSTGTPRDARPIGPAEVRDELVKEMGRVERTAEGLVVNYDETQGRVEQARILLADSKSRAGHLGELALLTKQWEQTLTPPAED